jgi:SNF2 family DNA or RNA helicase
MKDNLVAEIEGEIVTAQIILSKMLRLQQITSGFVKTEDGNIKIVGTEKLDCLMNLLDGIDEKVVVWCRFDQEIEMIAEKLREVKRPFHILRGGVKTSDRQEMIDTFQSDKFKNDVFISNPQAGGAGITLTASKYAIYYSRSFNFGDAAQSEDRIHRIGQEQNVLYIDIVADKTIDTYINKALKNKEIMSGFMNSLDFRAMAEGEL